MYAWVLITQIRAFGRDRVIIALWLRPSVEEGKLRFGFGATKNTAIRATGVLAELLQWHDQSEATK